MDLHELAEYLRCNRGDVMTIDLNDMDNQVARELVAMNAELYELTKPGLCVERHTDIDMLAERCVDDILNCRSRDMAEMKEIVKYYFAKITDGLEVALK